MRFLYEFVAVNVSEFTNVFLKSRSLEKLEFPKEYGSFSNPCDDIRNTLFKRGVEISFHYADLLGDAAEE